MKKGTSGFITLLVGIIIVALIYQVIKWAAFNALGVIGLIGAIVSIYYIVKRKKVKSPLYWPITGLIGGIILAISWFALKEWINTIAFLSFCLFFYFLITAILLLVRKNNLWKRFMGISAALLVAFFAFMLNSPKIETQGDSQTASMEKVQHHKAENENKAETNNKNTQNPTGKVQEKPLSKAEKGNQTAVVINPQTTPKGAAPVIQKPAPKPAQKTAPKPAAKPVPKPAPVAKGVSVTLVQTVDGDTIKVNYNGKVETVRYLLVDTPEEKKPNTCVQLFSQDAYNRNRQLVNSGKLTLEFENHDKRDKYGRLLAYVLVNGHSVQETLLKEGYARVAYIYNPPYKYLSTYQKDESIAKSSHLYIWSKAGFVTASGFNGCVSAPAAAAPKVSHPAPVTTQRTPPAAAPKPAPRPAVAPKPAASGTEIFANCTELRKKYPNGVPSSHPAYQAKMDRDHDNYACER